MKRAVRCEVCNEYFYTRGDETICDACNEELYPCRIFVKLTEKHAGVEPTNFNVTLLRMASGGVPPSNYGKYKIPETLRLVGKVRLKPAYRFAISKEGKLLFETNEDCEAERK